MRLCHEDYEQLAVGYALGALEPEDEQEFLAHLPACAGCERALAEHLETLAHLAYLPETPAAPPELLDRLRGAVLASGRPVSFPARSARRETAAASRATRLRSRLPVLAAAAGVVALLSGLGVWNTSLHQEQAQEVVRSTRLAAESNRLASAVQALESGPSRTVPLRGTEQQVLAVAVLHDKAVSLVVDGLTPNGSASRYVLWQEDRAGALHPVAAFDVADHEVDVVRDLPLPAGADAVQFLAVTREPRRDGQPPTQPSMAPLASGQVV